MLPTRLIDQSIALQIAETFDDVLEYINENKTAQSAEYLAAEYAVSEGIAKCPEFIELSYVYPHVDKLHAAGGEFNLDAALRVAECLTYVANEKLLGS